MPQAIPPVIPPFPPPPYLAIQMMYPPQPAYPGLPGQAHVQQRPQACGTTWAAQGGKREEFRRAWERIEEAERSLRGSEARVMGGADRVAEGRTEGTGRPQGGEAQAEEELQRAWADLRRRQERVERAGQEGGWHREGGGPEGRPPLMPFRQPAIPPEQESEMQERAWRRIRGEAGRLAERDREVAGREGRVQEEKEAVAVREEGQGGGRGSSAGEGGAALGGGAGGRGSRGGAQACQPQTRGDADGLGLGVATAAVVCAAAGTEGAWDGRGVDSGGRG